MMLSKPTMGKCRANAEYKTKCRANAEYKTSVDE